LTFGGLFLLLGLGLLSPLVAVVAVHSDSFLFIALHSALRLGRSWDQSSSWWNGCRCRRCRSASIGSPTFVPQGYQLKLFVPIDQYLRRINELRNAIIMVVVVILVEPESK
jgi:hypothetical protein